MATNNAVGRHVTELADGLICAALTGPWNPLAQFALFTITAARKERAVPKHQQKNRWSADVTAHSDALDLEPEVFEKKSAGQIAKSLKRSAEASDRRKSSAFRSAMSMLTFYMNRAGRNLPH
jgi:hypothetical protein